MEPLSGATDTQEILQSVPLYPSNINHMPRLAMVQVVAGACPFTQRTDESRLAQLPRRNLVMRADTSFHNDEYSRYRSAVSELGASCSVHVLI